LQGRGTGAVPLIGIDIGTQSLKAIVATDGLVVVGTGHAAYSPNFPRPGWAEQDPALWLAALPRAIAAALAAADLPASAITALSVCGQLDGCIGVNAAGHDVGPCIIWMDRRATAQIAGLDRAWVRDRTGLVADASHMGPKIAWSIANLPDARSVACWHQPVSYLIETLTGQRVMDPALASTTMLRALGAQGYDADLLAAFGISQTRLPRIANAAEIAGYLGVRGAALTGLPAGLPVAVGTGDDFATLIGCGVHGPGTVCVTVGTAEIVGAVSARPVIDPGMMVETHDFLPGTYLVENPGWLSGGAVTWACRLLGIDSPAAFSRLAATAPPGCEGLNFLPALGGAMTPRWNAGARGAFYGLVPSHGPAHVARAVLEGSAFAMCDVIERIGALGVATERLRLMGGGAQSAVWAAIRADASGRPVDVAHLRESSALGAALLAAVAVGIYPDIMAAGTALCTRADTVLPDPETKPAYDMARQQYHDLFDSLEPLFSSAP